MSLARAREACRIYLKDELPLDKDPREVIQRFRATVNMLPEELEEWLLSADSRQAVEQAAEEADRNGRHVARRIVEMLQKDDECVYEADLEQMNQITQYISCHRRLLEEKGNALDPLELAHLKNFGFDLHKAVNAPAAAGQAGGGSKPAAAAGGGRMGGQAEPQRMEP
ncbi:hypothetical protein CHLNCDRAFT_136083 [Chlorella variabilis]|uniref:Uncharacterized protein n=1 Tax=Chlorella variabilis TaxID=554065 RepID=E1ZJQ2_CHLVA|nr:hypothetical protein CHLNCDRAFT_136083 [Chlorella variabilis]EFN54029.1 hypothetical protein CHLNCDRAFT_136083 [Chlorella variabilis]|eukprot:XP_005846131.1 hypothetical protein CHLNCDRAFT_136083 [Chlorella variabilis]